MEAAAFEPDPKEYEDGKLKMKTAAATTVDLINKSKRVMILTGAGISTASGICDYRGPNGKWTLRDKGQKAVSKPIQSLIPTFSHMSLKMLIDQKKVFSVVSSNVDGLHRFSGISEEKLVEVHGNCFKEICTNGDCKSVFERPFTVRKTMGRKDKLTGGLCSKCGSKLRDTIVNFGDNLNEVEWNQTVENAKTCDLLIVLGSSITVSPSSLLPRHVCNNKGDVIIVNKQKTPYDNTAKVKLHHDIDNFMKEVMRGLDIKVPDPPHQRYQFTATEKIAWRKQHHCADPDFSEADERLRIGKRLFRRCRLRLARVSQIGVILDKVKQRYTLVGETHLRRIATREIRSAIQPHPTDHLQSKIGLLVLVSHFAADDRCQQLLLEEVLKGNDGGVVVGFLFFFFLFCRFPFCCFLVYFS
eukprot:TRINITY_DN2529_c1_g1_i3.p1 TRINITY_DN2529_c1_g1~~TRINITY_DN2529_c1_g1_i3.p1  ORF type:complete len:414 (+),score=58.45 TRINITY_DN2529_c1_g1_i3:289-1530(+)